MRTWIDRAEVASTGLIASISIYKFNWKQEGIGWVCLRRLIADRKDGRICASTKFINIEDGP